MIFRILVFCLFAIQSLYASNDWLYANVKLIPGAKGKTTPRLMAWFRQWSRVPSCIELYLDDQLIHGSWFPLLQESDVPQFFDQNVASSVRTNQSMPAVWENFILPDVDHWTIRQVELKSKCGGTGTGTTTLQRFEFVQKPKYDELQTTPHKFRFFTASCNRMTVSFAQSNVVSAMARQHRDYAFDFGIWTGDYIYQSAKYVGSNEDLAGSWLTSSINTFDGTSYINKDWETTSGIVGRYFALHQHWQMQTIQDSLPWYATWDDHDAGYNDIVATGAKQLDIIARSRRVLRLFFPNVDTGAELAAKSKGSAGDIFFSFVRDGTTFAVLDVKSHANPDKNVVLGASQTAEAVKVLDNSDTSLVVIASGQQLFSEGASRDFAVQAPTEYAALKAAIDRVGVRGGSVLVLSGDVHRTQVIYNPQKFGAHLVEFTSSGVLTSGGQLPIGWCGSASYSHAPELSRIWNIGGRNYGTVDVTLPTKDDPNSLKITMRAFDSNNDATGTVVWQPRRAMNQFRARIDAPECCEKFKPLNDNSTGMALPSNNRLDACANAAGPSSEEAEAPGRHNDRVVTEENVVLRNTDVEAVLWDENGDSIYFGRGLICDKKDTRLRALVDAPEWSAMLPQLAHESSGMQIDAIARIGRLGTDNYVLVFASGSLLAYQRNATGAYVSNVVTSVPFSDIINWPKHWTSVNGVSAYVHSDGSDRMHVFSGDEYILVQRVSQPHGEAWLSSPLRRVSATTTESYPRSMTVWADADDKIPAAMDDGHGVIAARRVRNSYLNFYNRDGRIYGRDSGTKVYTISNFDVCKGVAGVTRKYRVGARSGWHSRAGTAKTFWLPPKPTTTRTATPPTTKSSPTSATPQNIHVTTSESIATTHIQFYPTLSSSHIARVTSTGGSHSTRPVQISGSIQHFISVLLILCLILIHTCV